MFAVVVEPGIGALTTDSVLVGVGPVEIASPTPTTPSTRTWLLTPISVTAVLLPAFGGTATPAFTCAPFPDESASSKETLSPCAWLMPALTDIPAMVEICALRGISPREHASRTDIWTPVACIPPAIGAWVGCSIVGAAAPWAPFCAPKEGLMG